MYRPMYRIALCLLILSPLLADCAPEQAADAESTSLPRIRITCTVGMITDVVRHIADERADVDGIIGPGVDPHLYQSTRSDVARLIRADIVFYNGLMLEGKMNDALTKVARGRPVFAASERIDRSALLAKPGSTAHPDPHVWMDPMLWKNAAETFADALAEQDPSHRAEYIARYEQYAARLDRLDAYARRVLTTVPEQGRVLVTAHDAFKYFARAYGFQVEGIQGISTESEAGIADINRLVRMLAERHIPAVFVETSVSEKNVRALIEGAAARGQTVVIGGTLFSDAMGPPSSYEGTYIGMIDHNVTTITRALGGQAPEGGMDGRLSLAESHP
ncbi:MAG: metal ABC transporter solute-binding protein, Zn/Mn family [Phycisphaerae bacterium]